ncbi:MAG: MATE family efflux transporter [Clostridia bacterium]|nr:MATE family efflux transporter [Clostridia bacterium]
MQKVKAKIDFTEGKIFFKLLRFILPIVATNLLQMFYNAADMMVVSLSSEANAVGAIGTTGSFIHLILNIFIGFSVGANIVVAREIGSKNKEKTQKAVHTSLFMAGLFGLLGMTIGLCVSRPVLHAMGGEGKLLTLAVKYTDIYFLGVPFLALTNFLIAIFRAKGDAKTPLVVLTSTGVLNVGLNLFFVLVMDMSVEGVALATSIANAASFVVLLLKLRKDQDYTTFSFRRLKMDKAAFFDIFSNGAPAGIQGALFSLSNVLIQSSIVTVNNNVCPPTQYDVAPIVNGSAAAANIEGFVYTAMNAVYQGAITATSQNMGAKKISRIKKIMYCCFVLVTAIGVLTSGVALLFRKPLLGLYGVKDGGAGSIAAIAMQAATLRLEYICIPYFLCGIMDICTGVLRGMGKSVTSMLISLIGACLLRIIWLWTVFPSSQTLQTIFISYSVTWIITALTAFIMIQVLLKRALSREKEEMQTAAYAVNRE